MLVDHRARLLRAAVGFALVSPTEPELRLLHRWLDCWRGVGDVVTGMNRQGYWLHLSNVDAGTWRATFSRDAMISADGFGGAAASRRVRARLPNAAAAPRHKGDDGVAELVEVHRLLQESLEALDVGVVLVATRQRDDRQVAAPRVRTDLL